MTKSYIFKVCKFGGKVEKYKINTLHDEDSEYYIKNIDGKKREAYIYHSIDEAIFIINHIKNETLIRPVQAFCPICNHQLYNTKLDGKHFYCPKYTMENKNEKIINIYIFLSLNSLALIDKISILSLKLKSIVTQILPLKKKTSFQIKFFHRIATNFNLY